MIDKKLYHYNKVRAKISEFTTIDIIDSVIWVKLTTPILLQVISWKKISIIQRINSQQN